jgi:hypothetical protein
MQVATLKEMQRIRDRFAALKGGPTETLVKVLSGKIEKLSKQPAPPVKVSPK